MPRSAAAFALLFILFTAAAQATTIVLPTDEQLIAKSPVIVEGIVRASGPVDRSGAIWTETSIHVTRTFRGNTPDTITVAEIGGELDDRITKVFGTPEFATGEKVLLFLEQDGAVYRTVDLFVGKFTRGRTEDDRGLWVRSDADQPVKLVDGDFVPMKLPNVQREASGFETFVSDRVRGKQGNRNYLIENPAIAKTPKMRAWSEGGVSASFTMIAEPSVYRWYAFDNGGTAQWYSHGTQPGYSDGGISEIRTGMAPWTSYPAAKILYVYAGAGSGTPAGLNRGNGVNEILLNDPLGEITGSYNPATGGVVGQGGFNGARSGGMWTAPFAADATHPAGSIRAYEITEANLTIQDGVTPTNKISSSRLAEIIAHEFGHTLGFGHSSDGTALMYATVTGLGPSLRDDDQMAARWLYPSGTAAPQPQPQPQVPAAPSGLTATASGSNVALQWSDNASNETVQSVYVATGNGAFSRIGDVGANSRSANLTGFGTGTYRFYVTASNGAGESAASNVASVTMSPALPALAASFTWSPAAPTTGDTIGFVDQSTGGVTGWQWSFGDGTSSQSQNPAKRYTTAGWYNVTLTVYRNGESSSTTRGINITAAAPAMPSVQAAFDMNPTAATTGMPVSFTDRSSGAPSSWSWSFGDGATSTAQNPVHTYSGPGTYTVALTSRNAVSSSTAYKQLTIAPQIVPFRSLVSVTAQTDGVGGTVWRTELSIFNAGEAANVDLIFIPGAGGAVLTRSLYIGARQSLTYGNTLLELFGLPTGAGALAIEATGTGTAPQLKVSSRTYTGSSVGTYGQSVPDVTSDGFGGTLYLTGVQSNGAFRTNLGLVNRSEASTVASLALLDAAGNVVATNSVTVAPRNFQQAALSTYFPAVAGRSYDSLSINVTTASTNALSVYASVVDNRTQDPVFIQASPVRAGSSLVLPAVGRSAGANGTYWRSDVTMYNPSQSRLGITMRYLAAGADNRNAITRTLALEARQTTTLADVLAQMGVEAGTGALELSWFATTGPIVTSRTYTTNATGGTYGQSIEPASKFSTAIDVPGLRSDGSYRSNLGFVNSSSASIMVRVQLLAPAGYEIVSTWISLAPQSQVQHSVTSLFPGVGASLGNFTLSASTDVQGALFAYGSMVDNTSGDPVYFAGR